MRFGKYEATEVRKGEAPWERYRVAFGGGWQASIIRHPEFSYGGDHGLWEAAALPPDGRSVNDPVGWLDEAGVVGFLMDMEAEHALPKGAK